MATKSNTEIFAILGELKRVRLEGVTQKQFAQERGLSVRTLRDWVRVSTVLDGDRGDAEHAL